MTDRAIINRLPFALKERPLQWYVTLSDTVKSTTASVKDSFIPRFGGGNDALSDTIRNIKQKPTENVDDYVMRISLLNECEAPLPQQTLVQLTCQGLRPAVAEMVMQQPCMTMKD